MASALGREEAGRDRRERREPVNDVPLPAANGGSVNLPDSMFEIVIRERAQGRERGQPTAGLPSNEVPQPIDGAFHHVGVDRGEASGIFSRPQDVLAVHLVGHEVPVDQLRQSFPVKQPLRGTLTQSGFARRAITSARRPPRRPCKKSLRLQGNGAHVRVGSSGSSAAIVINFSRSPWTHAAICSVFRRRVRCIDVSERRRGKGKNP